MKRSFKCNGRWALITGAASGIGRALAKQLAADGCHLVLVDKNQAGLETLQSSCQQTYQVQVQILAIDLSVPDAFKSVISHYQEIPISILINNVGFTTVGLFQNNSWQRLDSMINLNIRLLTQSCQLMLPQLLSHPQGACILNVGSITGYQGVPNMSVYAGTKAFVNQFSEGLAWELQDTLVTVTCVEPGMTETSFFSAAGVNFKPRISVLGVSNCDDIAKQAITAMIQRRAKVIPGWINKCLMFSAKLMPRYIIKSTMKWLFADLKTVNQKNT